MKALAIGALLAGFLALFGCHHPQPPKPEPVAQVQKRQAALDTRVVTITRRVDVQAARTLKTAGDAAHAAETASGAATPVPADVLRDWGDAVDRLRSDASAAHAESGADGSGPAASARSVPAP